MNERIQQLEKQCWGYRVDGVLVDGQLHFDTVKFAELILKQCLSYVDDSFGDVDYVKFMIKRDFGVEE